MKRVAIAGIVGILVGIDPGAAVAAVRPGMAAIAAGLRVPVGTFWLIAPMLVAVAGAVTVGWRRAATETRGGTDEQ